MKIAYVIASYGNSNGRLTANMYPPKPATYISLHMDKLRVCDFNLLDTVFILKAKAPFLDPGFYDYNKENLPPIKEIDYPNHLQSYGQWTRFFQEYPDFDYYINIEDDYCLENPQAISLLIYEHQQKLPQGGFLCSRILHNPTHAAISNGIIDGKTIREIFSRINPFDFIEYNPLSQYNNQPVYQINFSVMFGDKLAHIADKYSVPYWVNQFIEYGQKGRPYIFIPSQMTAMSYPDAATIYPC